MDGPDASAALPAAANRPERLSLLREQFRIENQRLAVCIAICAALLLAFVTIDASTRKAEDYLGQRAWIQDRARNGEIVDKKSSDLMAELRKSVPIKVGDFEFPVPTSLAALVWLVISTGMLAYAYRSRRAAWIAVARITRHPEGYRFGSLGATSPLLAPTPASVLGVSASRLRRIAGRGGGGPAERLTIILLLVFWTWLEVRLAYGAWIFGALEFPGNPLAEVLKSQTLATPEWRRLLRSAVYGASGIAFAVQAFIPAIAAAVLVSSMAIKLLWARQAFWSGKDGVEIADRRLVALGLVAALGTWAFRGATSEGLRRNLKQLAGKRLKTAPRFMSVSRWKSRTAARTVLCTLDAPDGFVRFGRQLGYVSAGKIWVRDPPPWLRSAGKEPVRSGPPIIARTLRVRWRQVARPFSSSRSHARAPNWLWEVAALAEIARNQPDAAISILRAAIDHEGFWTADRVNMRVLDLLAGLAFHYGDRRLLDGLATRAANFTGRSAASRNRLKRRADSWMRANGKWQTKWRPAASVSWGHPLEKSLESVEKRLGNRGTPAPNRGAKALIVLIPPSGQVAGPPS